ncbi:MAG TPA: N-acetyltransferase [Rhizomicrobium sp.]|nr:N-acetyltransferase [Rhizomicrobium sp.]
MLESWAIRPERPEDADAVLALNDDGFGPGRFAKTAYRLREGVAPVANLSFVAEGSGMLLGSVRFWPIRVGHDEALLLGPLAVHSSARGQGIGLALMTRGIAAARATGFASILLVGDESYYARAGFRQVKGVRFPGPVDRARILGLALAKPVEGDIRRARIDDPVCADGAPLA